MMFIRTRSMILGWLILSLAVPQAVWAADSAGSTSGPATLDSATDQLWDSQDPPNYIITQQSTTKTLTGHGTVTITATDIGQTAPGASAIPVAGTNSKTKIFDTIAYMGKRHERTGVSVCSYARMGASRLVHAGKS